MRLWFSKTYELENIKATSIGSDYGSMLSNIKLTTVRDGYPVEFGYLSDSLRMVIRADIAHFVRETFAPKIYVPAGVELIPLGNNGEPIKNYPEDEGY